MSAVSPSNRPATAWTRNLKRWSIVATVVAAGLAVANYWSAEWILWEKLITDAVLPCSILLWFLLAATLNAWWQKARLLALALTGICGLYFVAGNSLMGVWLMKTLEAPYVDLKPLEGPPLDVLVVLGGGTTTGSNGVAQLGPSGDRVMLAARMYHRGQARKLICTGIPLVALPGAMATGPAVQTRDILRDLGVPLEAIRTGAGRNTFEEFAYLQQTLPEYGSAARVGVLTSAWHLPRAMRLAAHVELQVEPVPADFASMTGKMTLRLLFPNPEGFRLVQTAVREYLARLVDR